MAKAVKAGRDPIRIEFEIKPPYLVGAVVGTVASTYAAVVNHLVEPFRIVKRRSHRADEFTGCLLAVHAGHRLKVAHRFVRYGGSCDAAGGLQPGQIRAQGDRGALRNEDSRRLAWPLR